MTTKTKALCFLALWLGIFLPPIIQVATLSLTGTATFPQQEIAIGTLPPTITTQPPSPLTVAFYGDSRSYDLAEGAEVATDWVVSNFGRKGCGWRAQHPGFQEMDAKLACDTQTYVYESGYHKIAIVLAGTLLTQDKATLGMPDAKMVNNIMGSLLLIQADLVIVLDTPYVTGFSGTAISDNDAIDHMNTLLKEAVRLAATKEQRFRFISGFADVVNNRADCLYDGLHFTEECAEYAALWIKERLEP